MRQIKRSLQILGLSSCLLLNSCFAPIVPAIQVLVAAVVVIGAYTARTAIYQTVSVAIDEVVRPWLKSAMGRPVKDLVIRPDDPLRAELYGTFEFRVKGQENSKPMVVGQVPLVRATSASEWQYDPIYISRLEIELGGKVTVRQK